MKKKILYIVIVLFIAYTIWIGYLSGNNSMILITDVTDEQTDFGIEVIIDDKTVIQEIVTADDYGYFGKIHDAQIKPGIHKMVVNSEKLNIADSINFFSILHSKFYVEIDDYISSERIIMIDKQFGKTLVYE